MQIDKGFGVKSEALSHGYNSPITGLPRAGAEALAPRAGSVTRGRPHHKSSNQTGSSLAGCHSVNNAGGLNITIQSVTSDYLFKVLTSAGAACTGEEMKMLSVSIPLSNRARRTSVHTVGRQDFRIENSGLPIDNTLNMKTLPTYEVIIITLDTTTQFIKSKGSKYIVQEFFYNCRRFLCLTRTKKPETKVEPCFGAHKTRISSNVGSGSPYRQNKLCHSGRPALAAYRGDAVGRKSWMKYKKY
ncbi:hypothetical protein J6590_053170 [Homalodisca vitripennis]|nr:hypothetical protein J6590_053170 [Homalodisca vitripennis]